MTAVYFFAGILVILLAAVLLAPLLEGSGRSEAGGAADRRLADALDALRDIEFDHETGKLGDDDYRELRAEYAREAIAARDAGAGRAPGGRPADRADTDEPAGPATCAVCEARLRSGARFCSRCGTAVAGVAADTDTGARADADDRTGAGDAAP